MDPNTLIETATTAAVGALTKAAAEPALAAGRQVWDWLKGKVGGDDAKTMAAVEAAPTKASTTSKVTAMLQDVLDGNPQAAEELRRLLQAAGGAQAITQTANITGNNNNTAQVAGTGNEVRIG